MPLPANEPHCYIRHHATCLRILQGLRQMSISSDLRYSQRWLWPILSCGMWGSVVWYKFYRCFVGTYCLNLQSWRVSQGRSKQQPLCLRTASLLLSLVFHPDNSGSRFLRNISEFYQTISCHIPNHSTFEQCLHKNARWVLVPVWLGNHDRYSGIKIVWIQTFITSINGVLTQIFVNCSARICIPRAFFKTEIRPLFATSFYVADGEVILLHCYILLFI
jgi:hypothetical protein